MSNIEIISVVDNCVVHPRHSAKGLTGEHGLSMYISAYGKRFLFDTGSGLTLRHNLKALGLVETNLDAVVLSHGHYDHTGGLESLLEKAGSMEVYVHQDIFKPKYSITKDKKPNYNGLPRSGEEYEAMGARFLLRDKVTHISDKIRLVGPVEREKPSQDLAMPERYIKEGSRYLPDPFKDEQVLVLATSQGLLLVLGCTHNGLENTVEQVREVTGGEKIYGMVGGLHLCDTGIQKVKELALWLKELGLEFIACSHCTGLEAFITLHQVLGEKVSVNYVGKKIFME